MLLDEFRRYLAGLCLTGFWILTPKKDVGVLLSIGGVIDAIEKHDIERGVLPPEGFGARRRPS